MRICNRPIESIWPDATSCSRAHQLSCQEPSGMVLPHSSVQHLKQSKVLLSELRILVKCAATKDETLFLVCCQFSEQCVHGQKSAGPVPWQQQAICVGNGCRQCLARQSRSIHCLDAVFLAVHHAALSIYKPFRDNSNNDNHAQSHSITIAMQA